MAFYEPFLKQYQQINKKPQTKSYFNIFATLVLLIVLIALIFPALKHITVLNKELIDARAQKDALVEKIAALDQAKVNLDEVQADLPILDEALPTGSEVPSQVKRLETVSAKNGLALVGIDISDVPISKPSSTAVLAITSVPYTVTFKGGFDQFKQALADIENSLRGNQIDSITLSKDTSGLNQVITGKAFYLKPNTGTTTTNETVESSE